MLKRNGSCDSILCRCRELTFRKWNLFSRSHSYVRKRPDSPHLSDVDPTVSVLMPVYNAGYYLRAAVESVLTQTFEDFELLTLDDGSTDSSLSILTRVRGD